MKLVYTALVGCLFACPAIAMPNPCTDPAGAARAIRAANPTLDNATLYVALAQAQELYGCRAPTPQPEPVYIAPPIYGAPPQTTCNTMRLANGDLRTTCY